MEFSIVAVFADREHHFLGNTAAVVYMKEAISAKSMQEVASDLNQPATTFLSPATKGNHYNVRWFAPDAEIGICGHGSLAAVAFLLRKFNTHETITLCNVNGDIFGKGVNDRSASISLTAMGDIQDAPVPELLVEALGIPIKAYYKNKNKDIVLAEKEADVKNMVPDFSLLKKLQTFGYIITAPGDKVDFVSRTLVPHVQQLEDPATGSSHAALAPFWAGIHKKTKFIAHQLSRRGGKFICNLEGDRVVMSGEFDFIAEGKLLRFEC